MKIISSDSQKSRQKTPLAMDIQPVSTGKDMMGMEIIVPVQNYRFLVKFSINWIIQKNRNSCNSLNSSNHAILK